MSSRACQHNPSTFSLLSKGLLVMTFSLISTSILAQQPQQRATPVKVIKAEQSNLPYSTIYPVQLTAFKEVEVHSRITATIEEQFYQEGQTVKAGQVLYKLDDRRAKANYDQAKASLEVAKARLEQTQKSYKRTKGLTKSVSPQDIDDAYAAWRSAQAEVSAAEALLASNKIELEDTTIEAEISGVIGERKQDVGDLVDPNTGNSLLNTIQQTDKLYGLFSIADSHREKLLSLLEQGLVKADKPAVKLLDSSQKAIRNGEVDFQDAKIDLHTGSQLNRAVFDNQDQRLLPGQLLKIEVRQGTWQNVFAIPQASVIQNGPQAFVYVVEDNKASMRPVTISGSYENQWLISKGLTAGDPIITNNLIKVRPNSPVQIMPEQTAAGQPK